MPLTSGTKRNSACFGRPDAINFVIGDLGFDRQISHPAVAPRDQVEPSADAVPQGTTHRILCQETPT